MRTGLLEKGPVDPSPSRYNPLLSRTSGFEESPPPLAIACIASPHRITKGASTSSTPVSQLPPPGSSCLLLSISPRMPRSLSSLPIRIFQRHAVTSFKFFKFNIRPFTLLLLSHPTPCLPLPSPVSPLSLCVSWVIDLVWLKL